MIVLRGCAVLRVCRFSGGSRVLLAGENHGTPGDPVSFVRALRHHFPAEPISVLVESAMSPDTRTSTLGFASPDSNVLSFRRPPLDACRFRERCDHLGERVRVFPVDLRLSSYFLPLTRASVRRDGDTDPQVMAVLRAVLDVAAFRRDRLRYEETIARRLHRIGVVHERRRGEKDHRYLMRSLEALEDGVADRWCALAARRNALACGGIMELEAALRVLRLLPAGGIIVVFCGRNHVEGLAEMFEDAVLGFRLVDRPVVLRPTSGQTIRLPLSALRRLHSHL